MPNGLAGGGAGRELQRAAAADAWLGVRTGVVKALIVMGIDCREVVTAITAGIPIVPGLIGGEVE